MSTIAEQLQTIADNIPKVYEAGQKSAGTSIDVTAEVGQTIVVKEVDENGKPTKWESAEYQPRTHWTDETVILPETTVEVDAEEGTAFLPELTLVAGTKYAVKYNGSEYVCECIDLGDGVLAMGNLGALEDSVADTGEPFFMAFEGEWLLLPLDGATTVTVSITGANVTPIPTKYITNAFPYYIDVTGTGTTDDPYVCANAVEEVNSAYSSGRTLVLRATGETSSSVDTSYTPLSFACDYNTSDGTLFLVFCFNVFTEYGGVTGANAIITRLYLTPKADGTYSVTKNYPDME